MNKIAYYLIFTAVVLVGCAKEQLTETRNAEEGSGNTVTTQVTLVPESTQQVEVKSVAGANETIVKDIWVVQLNAAGTAQLQNPQYISSVSASGSGSTISVSLKEAPCKLIFLANTHNSTLLTTANAASIAALEALTMACAAETALASADGIPMTGLWSGTPSSPIAGVSLTRAVAKVTLNLTATLPSGDVFKLQQIAVKNTPTTMQYFRTDLAAIPYPAATGTYTSDFTSQTWADQSVGTSPITFWSYLPENARGTGSAPTSARKTAETAPAGQGDYCTYLEIKGEYINSATSYNATYRIFLGEDNITDYNVRRNTHYNLATTITGINTADTRISVELKGVVQVGNLYWTTGNLVADGANSCKIGEPNDYGLYFQFGSLVGWSGGENGDGTGQPKDTPLYIKVKPLTCTAGAVSESHYYKGSATENTGYALPTTDDATTGIGDPCRYYLGGQWRIPTQPEYAALFGVDPNAAYEFWTNMPNWKWTDLLGATHSGPPYIFFPQSGYRASDVSYSRSQGNYWNASTFSDIKAYAFSIATSTVFQKSPFDRSRGLSVRCVRPVQ